MANQNVINLDSKRTKLETEDSKAMMEKMLTLYCKINSINYVQGMNEVLTPFLFAFKL